MAFGATDNESFQEMVCPFCDCRCFEVLNKKTPTHIREAYGGTNMLATCRDGQRFEKERFGYCYSDIQLILTAATNAIQKQ